MLLQTQGITDLLMAPAKLKDKIPNISGTRNLSDNISDLKAQVAANNRGISLVKELIQEYSLEIVRAYMIFIQVRFLATEINCTCISRKAADICFSKCPACYCNNSVLSRGN